MAGHQGTHARGGEDESWVYNAGAELAPGGGRIAEGGGGAGGAADATGHIRGSGWVPLIDAPVSVAAAVNVALVVLDADVTGAMGKLFRKVVSGMGERALRGELRREVDRIVERQLGRVRDALEEVAAAGYALLSRSTAMP